MTTMDPIHIQNHLLNKSKDLDKDKVLAFDPKSGMLIVTNQEFMKANEGLISCDAIYQNGFL